MAGKNLLTTFLRGLIWLYRHSLSLFLGANCRFMPSCSVYADEALQIHGPLKGGWLALKRLSRCHPWGGEGYDPVPKKEAEAKKD
ncbi:MAG: membrane protein insertion efficiency factor YidD [Alphaproteobacteria bacterium]|nr:membrane protein insertion efficiency factor YidD [Alphaproteobacteria bacterium]